MRSSAVSGMVCVDCGPRWGLVLTVQAWTGLLVRASAERPGTALSAVEYFPAVISESFTLSLLTAALLKVTLELVLLLKGPVLARFRGATTRRARATSALMLWGLSAGSKLVVLWLIDITFGGAVSLGGFIPVALLVIALLVSRAAVRRLLYGPTGW